MLLMVLLVLIFLCAAGPAVLFCINLRAYAPPPPLMSVDEVSGVAVLIPARNEEANIGAAVDSVLTSIGVDVQVFVLDDASTDRTAEIVREAALRDARVQLLTGRDLPPGWNGKQYACWRLAQAAASQSGPADTLLFLDADVRVAPGCIERMVAFQRSSGAALVSGFPRLMTVTWLEKLLLPLIHFVLLSFLPIASMRRSTNPAMAAGCGQFLMANRAAYFKCGGHDAIRATMHDGLKLPRVFCEHGFRTDLADVTDLASVRMYRNAREVWNGLAKNATEGMAAPARIVPFTVLLGLGQVMPATFILAIAVFCFFLTFHHMFIIGVRNWCALICVCGLFVLMLAASSMPRILAVSRFKQPLLSALLHPLGVVVLLCLQWYALLRQVFGRPVGWRQREYASATSGEASGKQ
jgi:glycosyltransferase involved in cell wall biosynthesis